MEDYFIIAFVIAILGPLILPLWIITVMLIKEFREDLKRKDVDL